MSYLLLFILLGSLLYGVSVTIAEFADAFIANDPEAIAVESIIILICLFSLFVILKAWRKWQKSKRRRRAVY